MSWSINVSGPRDVVLKELKDAVGVISEAAKSVIGYGLEKQDTASVSLNGYVSWDNDSNVVASSTSHNISVARMPTEVPKEEVTV
jgi:hypothetical protein